MNLFRFSEQMDKKPGEALLIRHVLLLHGLLEQTDPWVPFPQQACCYGFGPHSKPLPVPALAILWARWPAATGTCPGCEGPVYGYAFGGLLSLGGVAGVCLQCHSSCFRPVGGLMKVALEVGPVLAGTPYYLNGARFGGSHGAPREPLVRALRRLGATELPGEEWVASMPPEEVSLELDADQLTFNWDDDGAGSGSQEPRQ